ncbi:hypothetical protein CBR_g44910 [Chara braunii]|uniref:DDE Tnp4 domain-containing protein n=1 Tax=Chara braunii TaxID=69332 RepID=A0A388LY28_CHABU|nr:hypothetical protein CBR_g44910 [Chara braunii]|eukprot:GBG87175.1 hypothetical protein CBR_g44910 [Chara braunii]
MSPSDVASAEEEWEDMMFMLILLMTQWVNKRNAAAMAILEAVTITPFMFRDVSGALTMLAGGVVHGMALSWLAAQELGRHLRFRRRRLWMLERSGGLWKDLQRVGGEHNNVFVRFCRLPRPLFLQVLQRITPHIQRAPTNFRLPLLAGQKFACALIRWATGGYYWQLAHSLGLGLASALRSNEDVADAILHKYGHLLQFPTGRRLEEVQNAFEAKGFPGCVGAIDCTHVYIDKPNGTRSECYYHHTGDFSVVAQVVCDNECRIVSVYVGCPGSVDDSRMLWMSPLYHNTMAGRGVLYEGGAIMHDGTHVGHYLLGDVGYPLLPWIMTPMGRFARTDADRTYNECHSAVRSCIERTFGRLKTVWTNFIRTHIANLETLCKEFMVVRILHNLMIEHRVEIDPDQLNHSSDSEGDGPTRNRRRRRRRHRRLPRHIPDLNIEAMPEIDPSYGSDLGARVRASLIEHVAHHVDVHGPHPPCPWR